MASPTISPEALHAAASIAQSLSQAITTFTSAKQHEAAKALSEELIRVSKSVTWLLREDRGSYSKKNGVGYVHEEAPAF